MNWAPLVCEDLNGSHSTFNSPLVITNSEPEYSPFTNSRASDWVFTEDPDIPVTPNVNDWVKSMGVRFKNPPSPPDGISKDPVSYPNGNDLTEPVNKSSSNEGLGWGCLVLSKIWGLTITPVDKDVLAGTKSLIILNKELSKNLASLIKSYTL